MGKYIKKFATHAEYQSYISGSGAFLPNVSTCDDEAAHVHYNPEPLYRTVSGTPYCDGYDKYVDVESQVSRDNGVTWETTATTATLIERNSADCGYVDDKLVATYDVHTTSEDIVLFDSQYMANISSIEIDGVELPTTQSTYRFSTTGEHDVKYTLTDPTMIPERMFRGATITKYVIPESVTTIEREAFYSYTEFDVIMHPTTPPTVGYYMFDSSMLQHIYVPAESVNAYKTAEGWSDYSTYIEPMA